MDFGSIRDRAVMEATWPTFNEARFLLAAAGDG
jgi:hypothetical protein